MAQTGFTPILIYSSSTAAAAPSASNLTNSTLGSELAINITDGKLFYKDNANAVQVIGWKTVPVSAGGTGLTSLTANGVLYASSTSTMATNANLTWNGTILEIGGSISASGQLSAYSATSGAIGVFSDAVTTLSAGIAVSSTAGPDISFLKNRGTFASPTGVNNGDTVGRLRWIARDVTGGTGREVARIDSLVDSVPAADDIAGSLVFRTRPSGVAGVLTDRITISGAGLVSLSSGAGLSISSTAVTSPAAGNGNVFSGTYTPTQVSTNTNVDSVSFTTCQYMRVGNVVTVSGQITIDATTATADTIVRMSVPIASNFGTSAQLGGVGSSFSSPYASNNIAFVADTTNDCAELRLRPSVNTSLIYNFSFTYRVI